MDDTESRSMVVLKTLSPRSK